MSGAALCVLPGCTLVEVAPPHTQITAPHMPSPVEEEKSRQKKGKQGERGDEGRIIDSHVKTEEQNKWLETWPHMPTVTYKINMA